MDSLRIFHKQLVADLLILADFHFQLSQKLRHQFFRRSFYLIVQHFFIEGDVILGHDLKTIENPPDE